MLRKVVMVAVALLALAAASAQAASFKSSDGITVSKVDQLSPRLYDVSLTSTAVDGPLHIRVLLPDGYDAQPARKWPVLYLIHGTSGGASDWTEKGDAEKTTAGHPFITVMPDEGINFDGGGYCTNWYNRGAGGKPMWETFEVGQVIPWIDGNLRTNATRSGRQIAGLSQGGFCSFSIASRHPDTFLGAFSYSGAIETAKDDEAKALMTPIIQATTTGLDGNPDPDAMFGPRATQEFNWAASDPGWLVGNLRGMDLAAFTGNGEQGPFDPQPNPGAQSVEQGVHTLTTLWKANADAAKVGVDYHDYGPGTHTWPYWARDLQQSVDRIDKTFAADAPAPARKDYLSGENPWSQWGYDVKIDRPAREFSRLYNGDASGFILQGSGTAAVVTPRDYRPYSTAVVHTTGTGVDRTQTVRADADGRLPLVVPLGPGNQFQQFTPEATAAGTKVFTTKVGIVAVTRSCASRRSITFAAVAPTGSRILRARATVAGKTRTLSHTRRSAKLSLAGLPQAAYRVTLVLTVRKAGTTRTIRQKRTFRTCTPKGK